MSSQNPVASSSRDRANSRASTSSMLGLSSSMANHGNENGDEKNRYVCKAVTYAVHCLVIFERPLTILLIYKVLLLKLGWWGTLRLERQV